MEYEPINTLREKIPKKSEGGCLTFWGWFLTLLVWGFLVALCLTLEASDELPIVFGVLLGISYIAYLILMFCSPTFNYLRHKNTDAGIYAKMGELFRTPPVISFYAECYHDEYYTETIRDSNGNYRTETRTRRVITHTETYNLPYYSTKDVSGLFLLNIGEAKAKSKAYIKLNLGTEVNFADAISYSDYMYQKNAFWQRNRYLDTYMHFSENRTVPGLKKENLIKLTEKEPPCISACLYGLFTVLTFGQFYKLYVDSFCIFQHYKIRKLVSTRYNLMSEDYSQQYSSLSPELNLFQQQYTYKPQETGYVFEANKFQPPTQQELESAQQYQQYVPNYSFQSIGGNAGIVQDIPQFQNVNYNLPPPAYANLGGDAPLPSDLLKPAPQAQPMPQGAQQIPVVQGVQQIPVVQGAQQILVVQGAQGVGYNSMGNQGYNPQGVQQNPVVQGAQGVGYNNMGNQVSNPQGGQEIPIQGSDSNQQAV